MKIKKLPKQDLSIREMTNQELYDIHQAFELIRTSANPMWKAVFILQRKAMQLFYSSKADNIPNGAKVNSLVKKLNEMQREHLQCAENGEPLLDREKMKLNGNKPAFLLKEAKTIEQFNELSSALLAKMVKIKMI